jgi:hypothetical protein
MLGFAAEDVEMHRRAALDRGAGRVAGPALVATALVTALLIAPSPSAQQSPPPDQAAVPMARFAGIWVGTQAWAISNPPPGASQDQPVTLELQVVDGKISGTMKPFLGGEDGATIVESTVVGDELRATAVIGRPRTQPAAGRRGGGAPGWKDPIRVAFVFTPAGVNMEGTANVTMGDVPWTKFSYKLGRKRSRY